MGYKILQIRRFLTSVEYDKEVFMNEVRIIKSEVRLSY